MIIHAAGLTSAEDDPPLDYPVIGWHNLVTVNNVSSDDQDDEHPASNVANPSTAEYWRSGPFVGGSPGDDKYFELQIDAEVDYLAIAAHNFADVGISASVEMLLDGSPTEWVELVEPAVFENNEAFDSPAIFRFERQVVGRIRLRMQCIASGDDDRPRFAVMYVGRLLVFERGVQGDYTPLPYGRVTNVVSGMSESGNFLGRIITGSRSESSASFIGLDQDWMRANVVPFLRAATALPFFFAWAPVDYPGETGFAWLNGDPHPVIGLDKWTSLSLDMTGIV